MIRYRYKKRKCFAQSTDGVRVMNNIILPKRHSLEDAQKIVAKLKKYPFDYFHQLFRDGKLPTFGEIEGDTLGRTLVWDPKVGWLPKMGWAFIGDNPFSRWEGKRFITPFTEAKKGKGINLFRNRFFPQRNRLETSIENSLFDQKPCLIITYPYFPSKLYGLRDELRKIDNGVFLGQGYQGYSIDKGYSLRSYFVLCSLTS